MKTSKRAILAAHECGIVPTDWTLWTQLVNRAYKAHRLAEFACNGSPYRDAGNRHAHYPGGGKQYYQLAIADEERKARLDELNDAEIVKLCASLGLELELQGDPRGCVVRVRPIGSDGSFKGIR